MHACPLQKESRQLLLQYANLSRVIWYVALLYLRGLAVLVDKIFYFDVNTINITLTVSMHRIQIRCHLILLVHGKITDPG